MNYFKITEVKKHSLASRKASAASTVNRISHLGQRSLMISRTLLKITKVKYKNI